MPAFWQKSCPQIGLAMRPGESQLRGYPLPPGLAINSMHNQRVLALLALLRVTTHKDGIRTHDMITCSCFCGAISGSGLRSGSQALSAGLLETFCANVADLYNLEQPEMQAQSWNGILA